MYILQWTKYLKSEMWHINTVCATVTTLSVHHMCRNNVMRMTYVLERHGNTDCCPVPSMGAHGALLWQSALNMSLGMLHYLHCAFLWPRWDMTGATESSWIKQRGLKAQGEGRGWWGSLGRQQSTGVADCNAHVALAWGAWGRRGRDTQGQREREERKNIFLKRKYKEDATEKAIETRVQNSGKIKGNYLGEL